MLDKLKKKVKETIESMDLDVQEKEDALWYLEMLTTEGTEDFLIKEYNGEIAVYIKNNEDIYRYNAKDNKEIKYVTVSIIIHLLVYKSYKNDIAKLAEIVIGPKMKEVWDNSLSEKYHDLAINDMTEYRKKLIHKLPKSYKVYVKYVDILRR